MDKIFETVRYDNKIVSLWQEAFGDSREDVLFFLKNAENIKCLCSCYNDRLCSMLFLVDCKVSGLDFKYIYAACTAREYRKGGHMSKLLEYSQIHYDNIILIPADNDLVNYYLKRKFTHKIDIDNILFNECSAIQEYLFEGCSLEKPFALAYMNEKESGE